MPSVNVRVIDYNKYPYGSIFSKMVTVINYIQFLKHTKPAKKRDY